MAIHRTTVPPAFEPGAAPDDRQLSPYAFFARPLLVAASHSLQNDSHPCYDPLLAVCSPGQGNSFSDVLAVVSRREAEALQFATFQAHFFQMLSICLARNLTLSVFYLHAQYEFNLDLRFTTRRDDATIRQLAPLSYPILRTGRSNDVRSAALIPPPFPLHPFSHTLRMQGSTHLLKDKAEREELAPICWSKAHLHFRFFSSWLLGASPTRAHISFPSSLESRATSRLAISFTMRGIADGRSVPTAQERQPAQNLFLGRALLTGIRLRKIPDPLQTFDAQKMGDGLQRRA
ncbi:hypothetical protein C8F01DRAFT_1082564 [Mycena amicta]|nr:hypothetical protein C8F01DRAFT_1082564 [Mycena amicta]